MTWIQVIPLQQLENPKVNMYKFFKAYFYLLKYCWTSLIYSKKLWLDGGCEHRYVISGCILQRSNTKTFSFLFYSPILKSISKSEEWKGILVEMLALSTAVKWVKPILRSLHLYCSWSLSSSWGSGDITVFPSASWCSQTDPHLPWIFHKVNFIPCSKLFPYNLSQQKFCSV